MIELIMIIYLVVNIIQSKCVYIKCLFDALYFYLMISFMFQTNLLTFIQNIILFIIDWD